MQRQLDRLDDFQLKVVLNHLFDGDVFAFSILLRINNTFKRSHYIYMWLAKNNIKGAKLVEFFKNEDGDESGQGILAGCTYILNRIDGINKNFNVRLKANELI